MVYMDIHHSIYTYVLKFLEEDFSSIFPIFMVTFIASYISIGLFCNVERMLFRFFIPMFAFIFMCLHAISAVEKSKQSVPISFAHLLFSSSIIETLLALVRSYSPRAAAIIGDLLGIYVARMMLVCFFNFLREKQFLSWKDMINSLGRLFVPFLQSLPIVSNLIRKEMEKTENSIRLMIKGELKGDQHFSKTVELPHDGKNDNDIIQDLKELANKENMKWQNGLCSGAVYHGESDHLHVLNEAYTIFSVSNPLHPDIWPSVVRMEAEVISMTANLLNGGDEDVCGSLTSGGTESIILAAKTHRSYFFSKGITSPEIIAPVTAHAAIDKACDLLNIKLIKVPVNSKTFKVDLNSVRRSISANTIMLYGSAPNFPQGIIDDIQGLSEIAKTFDVGLHVDACLGAFILPFGKQLGYDIPNFDFKLKGVTSMSCDTHKYGYASKGTSVVLYRNKELRRHQYFAFPEWTGGLYITPTIAGSRPGGLSAAAWASMMRMGKSGFMNRSQEILETTQTIRKGIEQIDGLLILGNPKAMVVCFGSQEFNILLVSNHMASKNWSLNTLQYPTSIHLCVTIRHVGKAEKFLNDLKDSVAKAKEDHIENGGKVIGGAAIYGLATTLPNGPVDDILRTYIDITLET